MFAFLLVPILLAVGAVVDYGLATKARVRMSAAVDAATLAAISVADKYMKTNAQDPDAPQKAIAAAKTLARSLSDTNAETAGAASTVSLDMRYENGQFIVTGNASGLYQTSLMSLAGITQVPLGARSQATSAAVAFKTMTLLLDISQSMGLAATTADMGALYAKTKQIITQKRGVAAGNEHACAFGCHVSVVSGVDSNSTIAKANSIKLRIDSLREAVKGLLQDANDSGNGSYYRFAMYTLGQTLGQLTTPTNNYASLNNLADTIDLGPTNSNGPGDSYHRTALEQMLSKVPANGNGGSSNTAQQYVVIVSDGVFDTVGAGCAYGHCTGPIDPAWCTPYKSKGVTVAVIYTTYLPVYNNPTDPSSGYRHEYSGLVLPFASQIKPKMEACASPGYFFEAADGPGINAAFKAVFNLASRNRLTQ